MRKKSSSQIIFHNNFLFPGVFDCVIVFLTFAYDMFRCEYHLTYPESIIELLKSIICHLPAVFEKFSHHFLKYCFFPFSMLPLCKLGLYILHFIFIFVLLCFSMLELISSPDILVFSSEVSVH